MDERQRYELLPSQPAEALRLAREWVGEAANSPLAHVCLSLTLQATAVQESDRSSLLAAQAAAHKALELKLSVATLMRLAQVEKHLDDRAAARQLAEQALHHDPDRDTPHAFLAELAAEEYDRERATRHYREALRISPREPKHLLGLLKLWDWHTQAEAARQGILDVLRLDPEHADAFAVLAQLSYDAGEFEESQRLVHECLRLCPNHRDGGLLNSRLNIQSLDVDFGTETPLTREITEGTRALLRANFWTKRTLTLTPDEFALRVASHRKFLAALPSDQRIVWDRICIADESTETWYLVGNVPNDNWRADFGRHGIRALNVKDESLRISNWSRSTLEDCRFLNVDLSQSIGLGLVAKQSEWEACNLSRTDWSDGKLADLRFRGCTMPRIEFERATLTNVELTDCYAVEAVWIDMKANGCTFARVDLSRAKLTRAAFRDCAFQDVDFTDAESTNATFENCTFDGMRPSGQ